MTQVIIVTPKLIHDYFTKTYPEWDTQVPVETIADLWLGLENGTLSTKTSIIIFSDTYLEKYSDELTVAIATFAPEALVLVLFYNIDSLGTMSSSVTATALELKLAPARYYPINTREEISQQLYEAFIQYKEDVKALNK